MSFSERQGIKKPRTMVQARSMDDALKNSLWNVIDIRIFSSKEARQSMYLSGSSLRPLFTQIWHTFFKRRVDSIPLKTSSAVDVVSGFFFKSEWSDVYDFLEFLVQNTERDFGRNLAAALNRVMETELGAYRFIDKQLVEISNEEELRSVEDAIENTRTLTGARTHLNTAMGLLSDRQNPDFRNSIKESISAVESICQTLTGDPKATLGSALKAIDGSGMHPALNKGLSALYGYTSDAGGVRHAMLEESKLTFTDAKFMLVACTAFINYLVGKAAEQNLSLN